MGSRLTPLSGANAISSSKTAQTEKDDDLIVTALGWDLADGVNSLFSSS